MVDLESRAESHALTSSGAQAELRENLLYLELLW